MLVWSISLQQNSQAPSACLSNTCCLLFLQDLADKLFSASVVTGSARFSRTKRTTDAFTLCHYAGPVSYSCENFLDKNRDFVVAEHQSLMGTAEVDLLAQDLFGDNSSSGGGSGSGASTPVHNGKTVSFIHTA